MTGRGSSNHPASLNVQERHKKDGWEDESNAVTDFNCWSFKCPSVLLHHPTWLQLQPWQLKPISSSLQGGVSLPWQSLDAWLHWCFHAPPVLEQNSLGLQGWDCRAQPKWGLYEMSIKLPEEFSPLWKAHKSRNDRRDSSRRVTCLFPGWASHCLLWESADFEGGGVSCVHLEETDFYVLILWCEEKEGLCGCEVWRLVHPALSWCSLQRDSLAYFSSYRSMWDKKVWFSPKRFDVQVRTPINVCFIFLTTLFYLLSLLWWLCSPMKPFSHPTTALTTSSHIPEPRISSSRRLEGRH